MTATLAVHHRPGPQSSASCFLPGGDDAPVVARRVVSEQLTSWRLLHLVDDLLLIASELVTNAVRHGAAPVTLALSLHLLTAHRTAGFVRLEVSDTGTGFNAAAVTASWQRAGASFGEHGRGLVLVDALADDWGAHTADAGHLVWADRSIAE
ncbi:ATP-binding protein [Streptomyces sp. A3M-1-3]|uniref:ATP-binding protein n=1 Tax=Streptomyces sp. A3M-1-3 TaxID=2962044 RepID=UPI0020B74617|nr:ATP-binding protein [Streptomyces sp. A3M-1-3]MCP3820007.1 ATP-binding protein [Streptomyces sp. A3M-1-3]